MILLDELFYSGDRVGRENVSPDFSLGRINFPIEKTDRAVKKKPIASKQKTVPEKKQEFLKSSRSSDNSKDVISRQDNSPFLTGCWDHSEVD